MIFRHLAWSSLWAVLILAGINFAGAMFQKPVDVVCPNKEQVRMVADNTARRYLVLAHMCSDVYTPLAVTNARMQYEFYLMGMGMPLPEARVSIADFEAKSIEKLVNKARSESEFYIVQDKRRWKEASKICGDALNLASRETQIAAAKAEIATCKVP